MRSTKRGQGGRRAVIGRPAAALSVATLTFRHAMQELEGFVPLLRKAAGEVEVQLR